MTERNDNIAPFMDEVHKVAAQAITDFQTMNNKKGSGDARTLWTLLRAAETGIVQDEVTISTMYKGGDKTEQNRRMDALLVHVFQTHEYNDKGKCVVRKVEKGKNKDLVPMFDGNVINALKTSARRMLPTVAYLYFQGGSDNATLSDKGVLTVRGSLAFSKEEIEEAPQVADNWVKVGTGGMQSVTMKKLTDNAKSYLGIDSKSGSQYGQSGNSQASGDVSSMAEAVNGMVAGLDGSKFKGKQREALLRLLVTLDDTFGIDQANKEIADIDAKEA